MTRYEKILEVLNEMSTEEIVEVHNAYCAAYQSMDDYIYPMCEFDEAFAGKSPLEIARDITNGDFNPNDRYFRFNGYANPVSFVSAQEEKAYIFPDDIARFADMENDDLGCDEIAEAFEEFEEERDDDEPER